jgi:NADH-quinone oxidoreductase subunit J
LIQAVIFYVFATILVAAALGVIGARNPVHSALFLVVAFCASAVLWLVQEAEFLAIVLVLVYVGAVMVLFLFVVMMLDVNIEELRRGFTRYAPLGAVVALTVVFEIAFVVWRYHVGDVAGVPPIPNAADYSNTRALGTELYTKYVYAFELAAAILLVAIVAAITLTHRRREGLRYQDISAQVAVRREDRVRVLKMPSEPKA